MRTKDAIITDAQKACDAIVREYFKYAKRCPNLKLHVYYIEQGAAQDYDLEEKCNCDIDVIRGFILKIFEEINCKSTKISWMKNGENIGNPVLFGK